MNDTQILSIAIMVVTVLAGALFNNVRIGDVNKGIDDMRDSFHSTLRAELGAVRAEMAKNHSEMLHRFGDLDGRLTEIERRFMR